jgi:hypothetical protein
MSVSFSPAMEAMQYQISCDCGAVVAAQVFPSFEVAYKVFGSPIPFEKPVCKDEYCVLYSFHPFRIRAVNEDALTVNMGGGNVSRVLSLLGMEYDGQGGCADGAWLLAQIQEARAALPVVTTERPTIFLGRYEGYEQDRLAELEVVAAYAAERNAQVVWG